jgi:hypothetical protein
MMTKRGLANALSAATSAHGTLPADAYAAMVGAVETLLAANIEIGAIRSDLTPTIVLRGLSGLMHLDPLSDWRLAAAGLIDLLWRGMGAGH